MKRYLLFYIPFLLLIAVVIQLTSHLNNGEQINLRWYVFLYFSVITLIFHFGLEKAARGNPKAFIRYYMGATSFKLFIHLAVILIFSLLYKSLAVNFIISFLIFYLVFMIFEVALNWTRFRR